MANEFTISGTIEYEDSEMDEPEIAQVLDLRVSIATKLFTHIKQSVGITEEVLGLGEASGTPGWLFAVNRDPTNFISIRTGTGGAAFCKLKPGEFCLLRLGSGASAPFVIADTSTCVLEYWVWAT